LTVKLDYDNNGKLTKEKKNKMNKLNEILEQIDVIYPGDENDRLRILCKVMIRHYVNCWQAQTDNFRIIAVEKEFNGSILNPLNYARSRFQMAGKGDLIVEDKENKIWYIEHKTAANISGVYIEKLPMDLQIKLYLPYLSDEIGKKISGVIYDVAQKTTIKIRQKDTLQDFENRLDKKYSNPDLFYREKIYVSDSELFSTFENIWEIVQLIEQSYKNKIFIKNPTSCEKWNRVCGYFPLCSNCETSKEQMIIDQGFEHKRPHFELSKQNEDTLTYSAITKYLTCPKKYYYRYIKKIVPAQKAGQALFFGSVYHAALAAYFDKDNPVNFHFREILR